LSGLFAFPGNQRKRNASVFHDAPEYRFLRGSIPCNALPEETNAFLGAHISQLAGRRIHLQNIGLVLVVSGGVEISVGAPRPARATHLSPVANDLFRKSPASLLGKRPVLVPVLDECRVFVRVPAVDGIAHPPRVVAIPVDPGQRPVFSRQLDGSLMVEAFSFNVPYLDGVVVGVDAVSRVGAVQPPVNHRAAVQVLEVPVCFLLPIRLPCGNHFPGMLVALGNPDVADGVEIFRIDRNPLAGLGWDGRQDGIPGGGRAVVLPLRQTGKRKQKEQEYR